jgi:hypothetical protein
MLNAVCRDDQANTLNVGQSAFEYTERLRPSLRTFVEGDRVGYRDTTA